MKPRDIAELTRPELLVPSELTGTFAERLALIRAEAGFALWAIQYGADWRKAWAECDRPDWLVDAVALCSGYEPRGPMHQRMTALLCEVVQDLAERFEVELEGGFRLGLRVVSAWAKGETKFVSAVGADKRAREALRLVPLAQAALREIEELDALGLFERGKRKYAVSVAAYHAIGSLVSPAAPVRCARAAAAASCGRLACPELARRVAAVFECPDQLRVEPDA